jgi:hypothetical protein
MTTRIAHSSRLSRGDESSIDLDEAIDCRICQARFVPTSERGEGLLRVGFRISLRDELRLRWARFRFVADTEGIEVASFFPRLITQPTAFEGRIAIRDDDVLSWEPVTHGVDASTVLEPRIAGHTLNRRSVFWDFFPWNGGQPLGTDNLLIALRTKGSVSLRFSAEVFLTVEQPLHGEVRLELPGESMEVRLGQSDG